MTGAAWDAVDRAIVHRLQQNARTTITDVAKAVNVSDNTVRNRIRRLEERGVIGATASTSTTTGSACNTTTGSSVRRA